MAKPATNREMQMLRAKGLEKTPDNLEKVRKIIEKEKMEKSERANKKGKKAGPQVTEPVGLKRGGMVGKKAKYANCGASVPASGSKRK